MNVLITGACGVTPRAIARSLRISRVLADATLIGTDRGGNWYGFYEGLYERVYRVPDARDPEYAAVVEEVCAAEAIDVALVVPEAEVRYWSGREFPVPALLPPPAFVDVAISKRKAYDALRDTGLVPRYEIVARDELLERRSLDLGAGAVWLRDYAEASAGGVGALKVSEPEQAYAWACLNPGIASFMASEHLPGRNLACCMLFHDGELVKVASYERLEYFGGHLVVSGITGNISRGRVVDDPGAREVAEAAVRTIADRHAEPAHGLVTVDLREDAAGTPKVTEINVRHTAATSALAEAGANMAEAQVLVTLGRLDELGPVVTPVVDGNVILRDIDGAPLWITDYREPQVGEYVGRERAVGEYVARG